MKQANVSELKNQLSQFLRFVKQGEAVLVLERGIPIAEIQPRLSKANSEDRLEHLAAKGIIHRGDSKKIKKWKPPSKKPSKGVLKSLLEERRSGR